MNAVLGMSEMLSDTDLNSEQLDYVDTIRYSGSHLLSLIDDILDFTKIESGSMKFTKEIVPLRQFLSEVVCISKYSKKSSLVQYRKKKRVEFDLQVADDVPEEVYGKLSITSLT